MTNNSSVEQRQEKDKQTTIDALKEMPIAHVACKRSGISRATYYRWRKEDKDFRRSSDDALTQGIEFINDMSESQLITLIREKKMPAIAMWLKHNHARYSLKTHAYAPISLIEDLTAEEQRIVMSALALTSGNVIPKENNGNNPSVSGSNPGK